MKRATLHAIRSSERRLAPAGAPGVVLGGKYELEKAIATGGMGRVWRARHLTLNSPVAVKFVEAMGASPREQTERFLKEAQVAASVRHRHIVDILDFGASQHGEPYMVMELLEGTALDQRMEAGAVPLEETLEIMFQLLSGLEAVHRAGIVHHDLKPANVFLSNDEVDGLFVRLLDFGISQGAGDAVTEERAVVGTPEYMSPEQAFGDPADTTSDIYSAGVILYELLAGFAPFEDDDPQVVLDAVAHESPPPLIGVRPDLPEICAVVDKAMSRLRSDRYLSAVEMRNALISASGGRRNSGIFAPAARADDSSLVDLRSATLARESPVERPTPMPAPAPALLSDSADAPLAQSAPPSRRALYVALAMTTLGLAAAAAFLFNQPDPADPEPTTTAEVDSTPPTPPEAVAPSVVAVAPPAEVAAPPPEETEREAATEAEQAPSAPEARARPRGRAGRSSSREASEGSDDAPPTPSPQSPSQARPSEADEAEVGASRIIHDLDF